MFIITYILANFPRFVKAIYQPAIKKQAVQIWLNLAKFQLAI